MVGGREAPVKQVACGKQDEHVRINETRDTNATRLSDNDYHNLISWTLGGGCLCIVPSLMELSRPTSRSQIAFNEDPAPRSSLSFRS
jgi:hypothetical protein